MTTRRVPRRAEGTHHASVHAREACAAFGLIVSAESFSEHSGSIDASEEQISGILGSSITLLHGASGAGKSRRLAGIERALKDKGHRVIQVEDVRDGSIACFDAIDAVAEDPCSMLALAGLAEPKLWALPVCALSVGERARLKLALAMCNARAGDIVLADEFCTPIDRVTAGSVCATIRRWAHNKKVRFVAASAHEDLRRMLGADLIIHASSGGSEKHTCDHAPDPIRYEEGTISDYDELGDQHYLGSRPAAWTRVIRAIRTTHSEGAILAGVLVVSMPTLNSVARKQAWGDRFAQSDKRRNAMRLNSEMRCLSRVVVDRRSRGLGIATGLVRRYLASAQTIATEAKSAMGAACPFLARAGMTEYIVPTPIQDVRLLDALEYIGIHPADLPNALIEDHPLLHRELMHWARSSRMLRDDGTHVRTIALMASCRLLSRPRAYAWRSDGEHDVYTESRAD